MSARVAQIYRTPSDIKEGRGRTGPKPRGWVVRFFESFSPGEPNQCWEWQGNVAKNGYGTLSISNIGYGAHRLAFVLANRRIDPDLLVMHSCDNPKCVNPAHLSQGTDADNIGDCVRKGRNQKGPINGMARLTESQVIEIRQQRLAGETITNLADSYGVHPPCISRIVNRKRWRHII